MFSSLLSATNLLPSSLNSICFAIISLLIITFGKSIPSNISNFAFKIFSLEPKIPICEVPILVIMDSVGFAILVNKLISPK